MEAAVGEDIMPTKKREAIGQVKPSGWHTVKYDCVNGKYLYNLQEGVSVFTYIVIMCSRELK